MLYGGIPSFWTNRGSPPFNCSPFFSFSVVAWAAILTYLSSTQFIDHHHRASTNIFELYHLLPSFMWKRKGDLGMSLWYFSQQISLATALNSAGILYVTCRNKLFDFFSSESSFDCLFCYICDACCGPKLSIIKTFL